MAKFCSTSLTPPTAATAPSNRGRQIVEAVARRFQSQADDIVRQADQAVAIRRALIASIDDPALRRSVSALRGFERGGD